MLLYLQEYTRRCYIKVRPWVHWPQGFAQKSHLHHQYYMKFRSQNNIYQLIHLNFWTRIVLCLEWSIDTKTAHMRHGSVWIYSQLITKDSHQLKHTWSITVESYTLISFLQGYNWRFDGVDSPTSNSIRWNSYYISLLKTYEDWPLAKKLGVDILFGFYESVLN